MKKRLVLFLILVFATISFQAQVLWKVSGNGLTKDSYILGTSHIIPSTAIDIIPGINTAINNCDIVISELSYDDMKRDDIKTGWKWKIAPVDSTLDKLYSSEEYRIVKNTLYDFAGKEFDLSIINEKIPSEVITEIFKMIVLKDYPEYDLEDFIDCGVVGRCVKMGRQSIGLETSDFQSAMLKEDASKMSLPEQAEMLLGICSDQETVKRLKDFCLAQIGAYVTQRLDIISSIINDDDRNLILRNRDWVTKLVVYMPKQACLVCVGAGHLVGDEGLLQLLRDQGYTVEPMK